MEYWVLNQRVDVGLEPGVNCGERAVVPIVAEIRNDKEIVGQIAAGKIGCELSEEDKVLFLRGAVLHVGHVGQRIVADRVVARVAAGVAHRGQIFRVGLPGLSSGKKLAHDVVGGNREARWRLAFNAVLREHAPLDRRLLYVDDRTNPNEQCRSGR